MDTFIKCPICNREFEKISIEEHVNKCLFLNSSDKSITSKRNSAHLKGFASEEKRVKLDDCSTSSKPILKVPDSPTVTSGKGKVETKIAPNVPLAEIMRPRYLNDIVGHKGSFGEGSMLRLMLEQNKVPNMILFGPPGCGKTSLANVIANICKEQSNMRFVKLSATMSGVNDIKEVVKSAKNELQFKRQTVLFMDEIHRFNKLQQDIFLPHVENGTIILIGATTENPSFSLNNALLSRCRVVLMEKLEVQDIMEILERAVKNKSGVITDSGLETHSNIDESDIIMYLVEKSSLKWLAEVCDGDARVALSALELALTASLSKRLPGKLTLEEIKDGIKRSHVLYDRKGEEHYNTVSAIHKCIRAGDDNAALYWTVRAMSGGEDPLYIARRLVRAASEDVGLADPNALVEAVACLQGCQHIGMPECDVLLAQCAVRLARAKKSRCVHDAMKRCQRSLLEAKGALPPVPLHLRNAPTKLMKDLGYGKGYNMRHKNVSQLTYMPEEMKNVNFFEHSDNEA